MWLQTAYEKKTRSYQMPFDVNHAYIIYDTVRGYTSTSSNTFHETPVHPMCVLRFLPRNIHFFKTKTTW